MGLANASRADFAQRRHEPPEEPVKEPMPTFGVALLDESRESGWACLGDPRVPQEPFHFETPQELRSDCVWVMSAEKPADFAAWNSTHNLRPGTFLSKLKYVAADLGLNVDARGRLDRIASQACRDLAVVMHRSMLIAAQCYPWKAPSQILKSNTLKEDIRKVLVQAPSLAGHMQTPLKAAYQSYSKVRRHTPADHDVSITMRFNRLQYAKRIVNTPVPDPSFVLVNSDRGALRYPLEKALNPEAPCFVKATVEFVSGDQDLARLCAFGDGPSRSGLRTWIAQPELQWLSQHARIEIIEVLRAETARPLPVRAQLPELLTSDPLFELSASVGLIAESHWQALVDQPYKFNAEDRKETTLWATWLRAADRAMCFELALAAHNVGFAVQGYGNGGVTMVLPRARLPQAFEFAMAHGVAYPAFEPIFREHGLLAQEG